MIAVFIAEHATEEEWSAQTRNSACFIVSRVDGNKGLSWVFYQWQMSTLNQLLCIICVILKGENDSSV